MYSDLLHKLIFVSKDISVFCFVFFNCLSSVFTHILRAVHVVSHLFHKCRAFIKQVIITYSADNVMWGAFQEQKSYLDVVTFERISCSEKGG